MTAPEARPVLSAAEAAKWAGVSTKTISRALKAGRVPGAERLPSGGWAVPVEGLLAAGFQLNRSTPEAQVAPDVQADERVRELEGQVAELRRERDVAVARAELLEQSADDLRLALRALTAGNPEGGTGEPVSSPVVPPASARGGRLSRWLRRP